jgi:hypothetical protein
MADVLSEKDDDEIVVVETNGTEQDARSAVQDDDDGDDEARMGTSEDDSEEEIVDRTKKNRDTRIKRRQLQKVAKERSQRELDHLRQQNAELMRRMAAVEGNTLTQNAAGVQQQLQQALNEARQAEAIMARAVEAGNGDDVATALRLRDEAKERASQLSAYKDRVEAAAKQAVAPRADPRVTNYAQQWLTANEWYDPQGRDEDSAITKAIDNALAREGWDPSSSDYWHELTRRVANRIGDGGQDNAPARTTKRKAPPTGSGREYAPPSTKNEVVVTPERKAAMMDAGVWDDPVARKRYLKAYQEYDRNSAR